ncbi:hypothetical protein P7K49_022400 [Saguinus oedipus]|uniref:Uncharacterized protein n=1 Tax=Saguinus oedipus TaxID=9490 RepID=A0ABQ9UVJ5_SAGOE|nr:hypothetical protein P7K49_022400 [Saguinus oedipus]
MKANGNPRRLPNFSLLVVLSDPTRTAQIKQRGPSIVRPPWPSARAAQTSQFERACEDPPFSAAPLPRLQLGYKTLQNPPAARSLLQDSQLCPHRTFPAPLPATILNLRTDPRPQHARPLARHHANTAYIITLRRMWESMRAETGRS